MTGGDRPDDARDADPGPEPAAGTDTAAGPSQGLAARPYRLEPAVRREPGRIGPRSAECRADDTDTRSDPPDVADGGDTTTALTRRGMLAAGGVLALLGLGSASVAADPQGQVGGANDPLTGLYTRAVNSGAGGPLVINTDGTRALRVGTAGTDTFGDTAGANVVVGYESNRVTGGAVGATIGGGGGSGSTATGADESSNTNRNEVSDDYGTIGGGLNNRASGLAATVGGGFLNAAAESRTTVGGGFGNTAGGELATVAGGYQNTTDAGGATVGGGFGNTASGSNSTVGGGQDNTASDFRATVGGGQDNTASDSGTTIGGGRANTASGASATVGGGGDISSGALPPSAGDGERTDGNRALGEYSTVSGGRRNQAGDSSADAPGATVGGGAANTASGASATVSGGDRNAAGGSYATVPGGLRGRATDAQSFVWNDGTRYHDTNADGSDDGLSSAEDIAGSGVTGPNTFHASATGGFRFVTGSNAVTHIPGGSAGWATTSTRAAKTAFEPVDTDAVLDGVAEMDLTTWEYRDDDGEGRGERHIGPVAEEFHDLVDVGDSDDHINAINADGVLFAAVQALAERNATLADRLADRDDRIADRDRENGRREERIERLEAENEALRDRLDAIEAHLDLAGGVDGTRPAAPD